MRAAPTFVIGFALAAACGVPDVKLEPDDAATAADAGLDVGDDAGDDSGPSDAGGGEADGDGDVGDVGDVGVVVS